MSTAHIYRVEEGQRLNLSGDILSRLADALGTSVDYLLGRTSDPLPLPPASWRSLSPEELEINFLRGRLAELVARLPGERQKRVMDAFLVLLQAQEAADGVDEEAVLRRTRERE